MANNVLELKNGQLSYVGRSCDVIPVELASNAIRRIDLGDNQIKSLEGLEKFVSVEELILDQNGLTDDCLASLPLLPKLSTLSLNKNNLKDLDRLLTVVKEKLPALTYLSFLFNPACPDQLSSRLDTDEDDYQRYRLRVIYALPQLKFLDFCDVKVSERMEAVQKGAFLRVVRPTSDFFRENVITAEDDPTAEYRPLPQQLRAEDDTRAMIGTSKYTYHGRHSEGNRYIRNNDL